MLRRELIFRERKYVYLGLLHMICKFVEYTSSIFGTEEALIRIFGDSRDFGGVSRSCKYRLDESSLLCVAGRE